MSKTLAEFSEKFRVPDLTILKLDYWTWSVRPVHSTIGAGVLSLNRFCTNFGAITPDEAAELATMTREIERRLTVAFTPDKYNYIMLMMVDVHLHFHVIPRYSQPREFGGVTWKDSGWPALPALGEGAAFQQDAVLTAIRDVLRKA